MSSSSSIRSITSSILSRRRKTYLVPDLSNLPSELLTHIFQYLAQSELHALLLSNSNFSEVAATFLYSAPDFASTYRFAQFVDIVRTHPHFALMVRDLDLSRFANPIDREGDGEPIPLAGWREWKYRDHDMFYVHRQNPAWNPSTTNMREMRRWDGGMGTHPPPSPLLRSFQRTRDCPIGGVIHVLAACNRLRKINLSRLQLASDFLVLPPGTSRPPATVHRQPNHARPDPQPPMPQLTLPILTNPSFWPPSPTPTTSPTPPSHRTRPLPPSPQGREIILPPTRASPSQTSPLANFAFTSAMTSTPEYSTAPGHTQLLPLYGDEIIFWLTQLPDLGSVVAKECVWLSTVRVGYLLANGYRCEEGEGEGEGSRKLGGGLRRVDFRDSGMARRVRWAVKGGRESVERIVEGVIENTREKMAAGHHGGGLF